MEEFKEDEIQEFEIPYELSYGLIPKHKYEIDETKLQYQNEYKTFEYYAKRFPFDYSHLKGFDRVIQKMADNKQSVTKSDTLTEKRYITMITHICSV